MGGKSSQSTQQISIPPEVLARYNAVNARAETTAQRPYQEYSNNPNAFVAPLTPTQEAGIVNTNAYAGYAQPYYEAATEQLMGAQGTAMPFYDQAAQLTGQAQGVGNQLANLSMQSLYGGQQAAAPLQSSAASGFTNAYGSAQPFNRMAYQQYGQGLEQGRGLTGLASAGAMNALSSSQPFNNMASQYMGYGARSVNPNELGAQQINQYMSPYLANVLQGTAALQNQMNQQAMSGQTGNAIRQGAFGGDRAGIAAANLAQQQQLANSKVFSDILNQGYNQALGTAQQQQALGLSAEQANRAAQQQAAQQALAIGQQQFGQGLSTAQLQGALGQQLYGMGSGAGQNIAALGQQIYGQGMGTAQQQAALAQQLYNQGLGSSQQLSNLGQQQFGQGLAAAQQNAALGAGLYGMGSQTAQGLANLGVGAQSAGLQGAQAQMAAGQAAQQTEQAGLQALYNQFLQKQSYPFQVDQFLANIAMGTGALSGSTTTTNQAMGGFSDKRLKENIKPVGKTFDGQTIYSYNFKGDPKTEIGLIAQEVEKHHPEAVGLAGGYRTVRYDKATEDAADRGHFASGGAAMGGGVMPYHAGEGFFDGGAVGYDPGILQQILASYERMYAPLQGQKGGLGAASYVPESSLPVGQLMTAGDLPAVANPFENVQGMVSLGTGLGELGGNVGAWDYTDAQKAKTARKKQAKIDSLAAPAGSTISENPELFSRGGLAGGRQGYNPGGPTNDSDANEIVVEGRRQPPPIEKIKKVEVPSASPEPAKLAPVASVDTSKTFEKPAFQKVGLDIPQIGNKVGLAVAPGLDSLKDSTGEVLQGVGTIAAAFSDKRLKENIKAVGKTFDGQTVYSYNYRGHPQTRMGLIAQEVEKHHPQAVGRAGGYKTVNYKQATGLAAKRGHFAIGGDVENDNESFMGPGLDIPMQGPATGLAAAPGLSSLKDSTGDYLSGIGSMAKAGKDIFGKKKAAGGEIDDAVFNPISGIEHQLDPMNYINDIISGTPKLETLMGAPGSERIDTAKRIAPMSKPKSGLAAASRTTGSEDDFSTPLPSDLSAIAKLIRGHEGTGKNPRSSAVGPYQMIDSTFVQQFRKMYPERAANMSQSDILAIRRTPEGTALAERMGPALIQESASFLKSRGHAPTARNIYLAHFFGPQGAIKVLTANPNTPIEDIVGSAVVNDNPFLRGRDAKGALEFAENAMARQQRLLEAPGKAIGGGLSGPFNRPVFDENEEDPAVLDEPQATSGLAAAGDNAPVATAPERAAKPKSRGLLGEIAHGDFVSGLGKGKATSWIPLLTGLATFGTTPTRSMLSGVLAGVGAGAQARQAQYEFGRQQQETGIRAKQAETQRMQIPISQQIADAQTLAAKTGNTNSLDALRGSRVNLIRQMEATGTNLANNPAYLQAQQELRAIEKAISDMQNLGVKGVEGNRQFLGDVGGSLSDPAKAQALAMGLDISGLPSAVPAGVASAARDTGKIIGKSGAIQEAPGYTGVQANITAGVQAAGEAATVNKDAYVGSQEKWHTVKEGVIPVLEQLGPPDKLPETGLGGRQLSDFASAVRVMASSLGYDASGINGDDQRSVITAAGEMLGIPIDANKPKSAVSAIIRAMITKVRMVRNAAKAASDWAKENTDPATGRPDFSRGNITDAITKAMAQ